MYSGRSNATSSRDILGHMQMSCAPLKFPRYNALHISSDCIMLRASCLKYNLSPYLQTPNQRSTYKDRLILLKEALFEEQDRCSTNRAFFLLVSIETNPSQCRSNEMRDFLLDSLDWKYLLYEHRSNVNWTVSKLCNCCTHICIRIRLEQRRESSSACFTRIRLYTVISWQ